MSNQPPFAEYPRPDQGNVATSGRGPGVYFDAIGEAWNLVMKDIGQWIAATLVLAIIVIALRIPVMIVARMVTPTGPGVQAGAVFSSLFIQMLVGIVPFAVQTVLTAGLIGMGVRKVRGEYINVGMLFEPFSRFGSVFGSGLLQTVVLFASAIACFFPILFFSPVLVFMPVLAFLKGVGPVESLSLSFDRCKRHWAGLLALMIVLGFIILAGALVCGVGLLVAIPLYAVVLGIHYRAFFESGPADAPVYAQP